MRRRPLLGAIGASVLSGCVGGTITREGAEEATGTPGLEPDEALRVVRHERREEAGLYYVVGVVKNIGVRTHEFQAVVTWYGDDGAVLGESVSDPGVTIEPGRNRRFDTGLFDTEGPDPPARYAVEAVAV